MFSVVRTVKKNNFTPLFHICVVSALLASMTNWAFSKQAKTDPESDMIIKGKVMRFDTKSNITTAEGDKGLASVEWGTIAIKKTLLAKTIKAKLRGNNNNDPSNSISNNIESIEATDDITVTFEDRNPNVPKKNKFTKQIFKAEHCHSVGKKIMCKGSVSLQIGQNTVTGTKGVFDLEHDKFEISSGENQQTKAQIHPEQ